MITFLAVMVLAETPEKTVQAFVDAFNARNYPAISREIVGGKAVTLPDGLRGMPTMKVTIGETKIDGEKATVEADVELVGAPAQVQKTHETIELRLSEGNWAIVPVNPQSDGVREAKYIGFFAYFMTNPQLMTTARTAAKKTQCLSNVKQLALGTMLYSNDHDEVLPKAASWKSSITPYVKNEAVFHCPEDTSGGVSYFLDPRIGGKSVARAANPAGTAMIVEGTPKKTAFRHGGMAALAFLDGHAKMVKPGAMLQARTTAIK